MANPMPNGQTPNSEGDLEILDPRPVINVPIDLEYSMQRYVNSHAHVEDRVLRPHHHLAATIPPTEDQSRARMAAILAAAAVINPAPVRD
ncbi:hypothetical protein GGS21DRAFT_287452 [Xylaria nigripes]|nr:hypothetical protein GGS21DRAFT_287452 [Xylaria nigripes]